MYIIFAIYLICITINIIMSSVLIRCYQLYIKDIRRQNELLWDIAKTSMNAKHNN